MWWWRTAAPFPRGGAPFAAPDTALPPPAAGSVQDAPHTMCGTPSLARATNQISRIVESSLAASHGQHLFI